MNLPQALLLTLAGAALAGCELVPDAEASPSFRQPTEAPPIQAPAPSLIPEVESQPQPAAPVTQPEPIQQPVQKPIERPIDHDWCPPCGMG